MIFASTFSSRLSLIAIQFAMFIVMLIVFAIVVHTIEKLTTVRLARRFGWNSVLFTGWLGTPVHELSHAFMCLVFRHRIDEIQLFKPDLKSGRLGYVRHSHVPGNWFQEFGNFFIGLAPLFGGVAAMFLLVTLFFPETTRDLFTQQPASEAFGEVSDAGPTLVSRIFTMVTYLIGELTAFRNLTSWRLYLFLYLIICIASHMAPSQSDYDGASRGVTMIAAVVITICFVGAIIPPFGTLVQNMGQKFFPPVAALLSLALLLCFVAAAVVYAITFIYDIFKR